MAARASGGMKLRRSRPSPSPLQVITLDAWPDVLLWMQRSVGEQALALFVVVIVTGGFVLSNLLIAKILSAFVAALDEVE